MTIPIMFPELNAVQLKMLYRTIEEIIGKDVEGSVWNALRAEQRIRLNDMKGDS